MRPLGPLLALTLVASAAAADPIVWDNGATLNGNPDTGFLSDDNWNPDTAPGPTDHAFLFSHADPLNPVTLRSQRRHQQTQFANTVILGENLR